MNKTKDQILSQQDVPSPKELMRMLHPELFSDTLVDDVFQLPKATFEYHLDTLTSRKQEYEFENFCRKLAEKEICPNLRVQTGPTGGGDSKVDTETYPVAREITERQWIGSPSAGTELWGFAFSAKKKWRQKVKTDVDKILSTGRNYKRIYFFTNQFVKDKDRAILEDTLSNDTGIPVHIIDRAWIVEKVYESGHLDLAISTLGIENGQKESVKHLGPRDTARLEELEELDKQIANPSYYEGTRYQLVEDCLRSAILARGLERNRNEVESRFAQTDRLAQDLNYKPQRLRIAYNRAWTAWWWHEDYTAFDKFYKEVEQYVKGSAEACEVQLLLNLWQLLIGSVFRGLISAKDGKVKVRQKRLTAMLEAITANPRRPNNALQAHTGLILIKIAEAIRSRKLDQLESCWSELSHAVEKSKSLGAYPIEPLFKTIAKLGEQVDSSAFDTLYEELVDIMRQRHSDREAGRAYIQRGTQKFSQKKYYDAIRWFGRAEELLMKDECRLELVTTLIKSSDAYESVGLLWASRNKALAAVEQTWAVFKEQGDITLQLLIALNQLVRIEIRLGRIPHVLDAMAMASYVASNLELSEHNQDVYSKQLEMQDLVLGIHMLNLPFDALSGVVVRLPDALERLGLICAWATLLFVLGHEQVLRDEGNIFVSEDPDADQEFFERWQDQPAADDISPQPILIDGETSLLKSTILGAEVVMETPNNAVSLGLTESLLGVLEAFLATSYEHAMPHRERMTITVKASQQMRGLPKLRFADNDGGRAEIVHPAELAFTTAAEQHSYMEWLRNSLIEIMCRTLMIKDIDVWLEEVADQERGFSRALALGDVFMLNTNVFGERPKVRLVDWLETDDRTYTVLRSEPWRITKSVGNNETTEPKFATGPPPSDLIDKAELKHTDYKVISPIDELLWDQAKWQGMLFYCFAELPPILAFIFEDGNAGRAIFDSWKKQWGNEDKNEELRLAIVTGLSKQNPTRYAVSVGPSLRHLNKHTNKTFTLVSQIRHITPTSSKNLDNFLMAYKKADAFSLAPAQMNGDEEPTLFPELMIAKKELVIREAWEIGENDPDKSVLLDGDDPIIPNQR